MAVTSAIEGTILVIRVEGEWSTSVAEGVRTNAVAFLREQPITGLLVDLSRAVFDANVVEIFEFTAGHAEIFPPRTRHAVIINAAFAATADAPFAENVARNRGVQMRMFQDEASARAWLDEPTGK